MFTVYVNNLSSAYWDRLKDCYRTGYKPCESCNFTRSICIIYIKLGNMVRKSGKNREGYQQNWEKSELLHSQHWHCIPSGKSRQKSWRSTFLLIRHSKYTPTYCFFRDFAY